MLSTGVGSCLSSVVAFVGGISPCATTLGTSGGHTSAGELVIG